jgi:hypothetical protein
MAATYKQHSRKKHAMCRSSWSERSVVAHDAEAIKNSSGSALPSSTSSSANASLHTLWGGRQSSRVGGGRGAHYSVDL